MLEQTNNSNSTVNTTSLGDVINAPECIIKFKRVDGNTSAPLPRKAHVTDAGYDIYPTEQVIIEPGSSKIVPTGLELAYITPGYWFKIEAKSGLGFKYEVYPHPGIIDNGYRGNLAIKVYNHGDNHIVFNNSDGHIKLTPVAQLIVYKMIDVVVEEAAEIEPADRGNKGFGSTH
jgi:dUTP pyrophosphatase